MKTTFFVLALPATAAQADPLTTAQAASRPPQEPSDKTRHGSAPSDPYRSMEQGARAADMTAWIKASSEHTAAELAALPERAVFAGTLEKTTRAGVRHFDVQSAGAALFHQRLDPAAGTTQVAAIGNYSSWPDDPNVAVPVSPGGAEAAETRVLDVATGKQVGAVQGPTRGKMAVTLP